MREAAALFVLSYNESTIAETASVLFFNAEAVFGYEKVKNIPA